MKRVCAWCGKDMGRTEPLEDLSTTHGICESCRQKMANEMPCSVCGACDWWYLKSTEAGKPGVWNCGKCHPDPNRERSQP